jgi:hypothetical protein
MLILLSPSKTQEAAHHYPAATQPEMLKKAEVLAAQLKKLDTEEIIRVMQVSKQLAEKTRRRSMEFQLSPKRQYGCQALLAFRGDVFSEIDVDTYSEDDFLFAQNHLRILSGLYGILRPLDLIQPYRLEMGGTFRPERDLSLYDYWRDDITAALNRHIAQQNISEILNLASTEYFKAVNATALQAPVITVSFKQLKGGSPRTVAIHAKKARGALADYIIGNRLRHSAELHRFSYRGYLFAEELSTTQELLFLQKETG